MRTHGELTARVLTRLGDAAQAVWTVEEIGGYLTEGLRELAVMTQAFWDQHVVDVGYDDDGDPVTPVATHTLPETVCAIDRGTFDGATIDAVTHRQMRSQHTRYETTRGPVYGYLWQTDGLRTVRFVRIPSQAAETVDVDGTFGGMRDGSTFSEASTGTWGACREVPGHHPLGTTDGFGIPRRVYLDGQNVRFDHWRHARTFEAPADVCELPDRYADYLTDYAQWKALSRIGPGRNPVLAGWYEQRWGRDVARIQRRLAVVSSQRVSRLGGTSRTPRRSPLQPGLPGDMAWPRGWR